MTYSIGFLGSEAIMSVENDKPRSNPSLTERAIVAEPPPQP